MTLNDPFANLPEVRSFDLVSTDIADGSPLPLAQQSRFFGIEGGADISPQLSWSNVPRGARSFTVTMFAPDAPTGSGFWHWAVMNIPSSEGSLPTGAGDNESSLLPRHAVQLPNDIRASRYIGAAPDATGLDFRYVFVVSALDVKQLDIPPYSTPAYLGFRAAGHVIASDPCHHGECRDS